MVELDPRPSGGSVCDAGSGATQRSRSGHVRVKRRDLDAGTRVDCGSALASKHFVEGMLSGIWARWPWAGQALGRVVVRCWPGFKGA